LGSGTSHGIPVAGCFCPVCQSSDERNRRYRASILIEGACGETVIVDTGPEFRLQTLRAGICSLDAVFLTHAHADHLHGIDDVRPFTYQKPLPVYANSATLKELKDRFSYIFKRPPQKGGGRPKLTLCPVKKQPVVLGGLSALALPVKHGILDVLGWKFSEGGHSAAYITDASFVPEETINYVRGCEILVLGGLRKTPHATHFSFPQALEFAKKTNVPNVYITHICHNHSHIEIEAFCSEWAVENGAAGMCAQPAFDGLQLSL
jgi:phosphoribosyl 1,2-cyclic phosphate phosphodiesterase